jgi:hypothetical protein
MNRDDFMQHPWVEVVNEDGDVWILDSVLEVGRIEAATKAGLSVTPLYKKKEWQGLTDEEAKEVWKQLNYDLNHGKFAADDTERHVIVEFYRAIEAKLKEKNSG